MKEEFVGYVIKLDQRRRHKCREAEKKKIILSKSMPLVKNLSNPRIIIPKFDWELLRHVTVSEEAAVALEKTRKLDGDSAYRPIRLCLAELDRGETATVVEAHRFLKKYNTRYATAPELIGFLYASVFREAFADRVIVALGTHLRDEFDHREALAFTYHSKDKVGALFILFAERIRHDWLLLIAAEGAIVKT